VETTLSSAQASGSLGKVTINNNELGMSAGTFLLYKKNGDAWAETYLYQYAYADDSGYMYDGQYVYSEIMGPMAPSLGDVSSWDGSGTSCSFVDLKAAAGSDNGAIKSISQTIPSVQSYFWADGTNDLMYNGPGFVVASAPTMVPYGYYYGVTYTGTPSQSQRYSAFEVAAYQ
jgi:hypothetical protein